MTSNHQEVALNPRPASPNDVDEEKTKQCASSEVDNDVEFSLKEQRRVIHIIDRRLVVILGLMYCVSLIDRTNLSNAAIAGMTADLNLDIGFRYVSTGFPLRVVQR